MTALKYKARRTGYIIRRDLPQRGIVSRGFMAGFMPAQKRRDESRRWDTKPASAG